MMERTLIIIKPRTVSENKTGEILSIIEKKDFKMISAKTVKLSMNQAKEFYAVHKGKVFYEGLVKFLASGTAFVAVFEGDNIISRMRKLMGNTNPELAEEVTLRKLYGHNLRENAIHGSDSVESANNEINFFFSKNEILFD